MVSSSVLIDWRSSSAASWLAPIGTTNCLLPVTTAQITATSTIVVLPGPPRKRERIETAQDDCLFKRLEQVEVVLAKRQAKPMRKVRRAEREQRGFSFGSSVRIQHDRQRCDIPAGPGDGGLPLSLTFLPDFVAGSLRLLGCRRLQVPFDNQPRGVPK